VRGGEGRHSYFTPCPSVPIARSVQELLTAKKRSAALRGQILQVSKSLYLVVVVVVIVSTVVMLVVVITSAKSMWPSGNGMKRAISTITTKRK